MKKKLIRKFKKFLKFRKTIEGSGAFQCLLDDIFGRENLLQIRMCGADFYIRTNTPDLKVAIGSLYDSEYANIRANNPKTIIDAGANIGTSTIYFALKYPDARIIAIEPEDGNFDLLVKNTRNFKNVIPVKAAIWGFIDQRTIQNRGTGHWGYTVSDTQNNTESTGQQINCITIQSLMEQYQIDKIDLLKMDIEGGEKNVLENAADWIDQVDIMTVELHDRIAMGCTRAFYLATKDFTTFEINGEKVTAYRH